MNKVFVDGMKFKVDGKEEGKIHLTTWKAMPGTIWKQVKDGIENGGGNDGSEKLEHGGFNNRVHTLTRTTDQAGKWTTTSTTSLKKTLKSSYDKTKTSTDSYETVTQPAYTDSYGSGDLNSYSSDYYGAFAQLTSMGSS
jgi:hypothetical protein